MRKRIRLLISISALVILTGAIFFAGWPQLSSGQSDFYLYQLEVHCIPRAASAIFTVQGTGVMGTKQVCAGKCGGGIVTLDEALAKFPAGMSATLRTQVENAPVEKVGCVTGGSDGKKPPDDKKPKCVPPAKGSEDGPWNPADCKDFQDVLVRRTGRSIVISACGQVLGKAEGDELWAGAMRGAWPSKICCDKLKGPRNTPCDYSLDVDCDGTPNGRDDMPDNYDGEESFYTIPPGTTYDPLPEGLRLSRLLPDIACDGCKWELVKGVKKCQARSSGTGLFWYEATWRCPKTGMEVWRPSKQRLLKQKCK